MSLIHSHSCECANPELDLFSVPPTHTSLEGGQWIEYRPMSSLVDQGPIEFIISGSGEDYLDLSNSYLQLTAKIVTNDDKACKADGDDADKVGPVNLWLHSLFSQVDVNLNGKLITPSTNTYPYRAYLETLLTFGKEAKNTSITSALWAKDHRGRMDEPSGAANKGLLTRCEITNNSQKVDLMGKLHLDLFYQDRYLLNGVDLKIRLIRSKPTFCLMADLADVAADKSYKVALSNVALHVRHVKLNPTIQMAHIKTMEKTNAKYPLRRIETKVFSVPAQNLQAVQENLFLGQIPKRVVIGCVDNDAFNGSYTKNPYNFKHNDINYLALCVDGHQIPAKPFQPNFEQKQYIRSYLSLFTGTGMMYQDEGNDIDIVDFANGFTLWCLDLTPDLSAGEGGHFNVLKQGNMRLEMHFAKALQHTINVLVYAEFDNLLEIDRYRNIVFDYNA